jgi:hypothetical protein
MAGPEAFGQVDHLHLGMVELLTVTGASWLKKRGQHRLPPFREEVPA